MTNFNIGQITTINAADVDTTADKFLFWDNSESGAARTKAMTAQQSRLLVQGVDTQRGSTKPTQRSDGTSLQTGDRWWDTSDNRWWFWNGTYWLSEQSFSLNSFLDAGISASLFPGGVPINVAGNDIYLERIEASIILGAGTYGASDYWDIRINRVTSADAGTVDGFIRFDTAPATTRSYASSTINLHRDVSALAITNYRFTWIKTGAPGTIASSSGATVTYRLAKP